MSRAIILDAFYGQLSDFLTELGRVFPDAKEVGAAQTKTQLLRRTNPALALTQMVTTLGPYEHQIRTRNASDFLCLPVIGDILQSYWAQMTPENKSVVWAYIILLLDLAKRYTG